ncbi:MAG: hypothetical protein ABL950_00975, partial [Nitrospira sp.]
MDIGRHNDCPLFTLALKRSARILLTWSFYSQFAMILDGQRWFRLVGQFFPGHKWRLAVQAYAALGCADRFS